MTRIAPDIPSETVAGETTSGTPLHSPPSGRVMTTVTIAAFVVPVAAYFWLIHHFAVNVVYLDQWSDVSLLGRSYAHTLTAGNLWAQHGEQRMLLPNLVMLLLGHVDHLDIVVEEYISALMLCAATALIIVASRRRSASRSWIAYSPVAVLMLSLVQASSTLFGFQLAWYLVILCFAATLFLLDRPALSGLVLGAAMATAVAGSLSSTQGLLIWPCGLILLYQRRRPRRLLVAWCSAGIGMGLVYAYGYKLNQGVPPGLSGIDLPGPALRSFFQVIGSVLGVHLSNDSRSGGSAVLLFGVLLFAIAVYALVSRGLRRDTSSGAPIGVALICFGLLYAVAFADARAFGGPAFASESQYTTFTILIVVGCYLALLDSVRSPWKTRTWVPSLGGVVALALIGVLCLQVVLGEVNGVRRASAVHQRQTGIALAIADVGAVPDPILQGVVAGYGLSPGAIRADVEILREHRLTFYEDPSSVTTYVKEARAQASRGLFRYTPPPVTAVVRPVNGQVLRGQALIDVLVQPGVRARSVDIHLSGPALTGAVIGSASRTEWGWILRWNTTTVPDGSYEVESVTSARQGRMLTSTPVAIRVENR
jgi:hypothetical protein